jgi:3-methylcrotonyl-CoA carboxylase alpha subunit
MQGALRAFRVSGPATNLEFLFNLVSAGPFAAQDLDTEFIARHGEVLFRDRPAQQSRDLAAAALALLNERAEARQGSCPADPWSPWTDTGGWQLNQAHSQSMRLHCHGGTHHMQLLIQGDEYRLRTTDRSLSFRGAVRGDLITLEIEGRRVTAALSQSGGVFTLFWDDGACQFREVGADVGEAGVAAGDSEFAAPMHGTIVALLCEPGSTVEAGDGVLVMEAMKMEQTLRAPCAGGTLHAYPCAVGDLVRGRTGARYWRTSRRRPDAQPLTPQSPALSQPGSPGGT